MSDQFALFVPEWRTPQAQDLERRILLVVEECRKLPEWPADDVKDRMFALDLIESFPTANLPKLIASWRDDWGSRKAQIKDGKGVNLRARIKRWCSNDREWKRRGQPVAVTNSRVRRTGSTAPRTAADFSDADGKIRPW